MREAIAGKIAAWMSCAWPLPQAVSMAQIIITPADAPIARPCTPFTDQQTPPSIFASTRSGLRNDMASVRIGIPNWRPCPRLE
jgi:hypothetical protein